MDKRIKSLISLCQKAGKIISGEESCERALQKKNAKLVLICEDASDNTKKKFINKAFYYKVDAIIFGTKDDISNAIGKINRATIIVTDENFANKLKELIGN